MPENIILAVKNLVAGYGETEILHDVNVKVSKKDKNAINVIEWPEILKSYKIK